MMPRLGGMDVHEALMCYCPEQAERMVFVTGGPTSADSAAFLEMVPNARLYKPFGQEAVLDIVERAACWPVECENCRRSRSGQLQPLNCPRGRWK